MKLLCVIDCLGPGGAQRQLVELALGIKENGNEVTFLTYHNNPFFNANIEKAGIIVISLNEPNYLKRFFRIRHYIRNGNFDSVLSFLEGANFLCEFSGLPFRRWNLVVGERSANPKILKSLKLKIYRWFHLFADYIVANSNSNLQIICSVNPLLSKKKCKVIYNLIDFDRWKPLPVFENRKITRLKLIIVASQIYLKNLTGLIEALVLLDKEELEKIEIEWYGDHITEPYYDSSFPEGKQKISEMNLEKVISFYPATNEITSKIQEADAVGLFSFVEGLPNVVCEAMACAKPVICSNVSDVPELLSFDKNLICDPTDSHSIKKSLSYLISLNKEQLIRIGYENLQTSLQRFAKEKIVSDYMKLLNK